MNVVAPEVIKEIRISNENLIIVSTIYYYFNNIDFVTS